MDVSLAQVPEIKPYLDAAPDLSTTARRVSVGGRTLLIVRQTSEFEGDEIVFIEEGGRFRPLADKPEERGLWWRAEPEAIELRVNEACVASADADHSAMFTHVLTQVNVFDSSTGPDGGNLACVWAVRHLAKKALERWITRTDSTTEFGEELMRCYQPAARHEDVAAGGIVISPTEWTPERRTGHVGFLGEVRQGGSRLIYSNSSSAAKLKQNFTVDSWVRRYKDQKGLKVHYFKLPNYVPVGAPS